MAAMTLVVLVVTAVFSPSARGQAGTVQGTLSINGKPVGISHAYVHLHNNEEKVISRPRELRILLADREVPSDALNGVGFSPIWDLAREGKVRGILMELDPAKPDNLNIVILDKPSEPGHSLATLSLSRTGTKMFKQWTLTPKRLTAAIDHEDSNSGNSRESGLPSVSFSVSFDAPVVMEPSVTADLKGAAARSSPQVQALAAKADALIRSDMAALRKNNTQRANRRLDTYPPEVLAQFKTVGKQAGIEQKKTLARVQRVVVRGKRAIVILSPNEWATVAFEDGKWKVDD